MRKTLLAFIFLFANCVQKSPLNLALASYRRQNNAWDMFILTHTLDPDAYINANYMRWTTYDWDNFLCLKDYHHRGEPISQKYLNTVIVANSYEVEKAFKGPLVHYGYTGSGMAWSNRPFQTFIMMRDGGRLTVYECGELYIAAKLKRGGRGDYWGGGGGWDSQDSRDDYMPDVYPAYIVTSSVAPYYYPYEADNRYNYNRYCYRVPE